VYRTRKGLRVGNRKIRLKSLIPQRPAGYLMAGNQTNLTMAGRQTTTARQTTTGRQTTAARTGNQPADRSGRLQRLPGCLAQLNPEGPNLILSPSQTANREAKSRERLKAAGKDRKKFRR
jgi:hypothetical protein